jgi:hypothetical protein
MDTGEILNLRYEKFRKMGAFIDDGIPPFKKLSA